jgi:hypothetical protein
MRAAKRSVGGLNGGQTVMRRQHRMMVATAVCTGALVLAGCNKLSQVGRLSQPAPTASAATVAQPFTLDATGTLRTTVRAGADVVLTGTNSEKGAGNSGVPIITYTWTQQSSDATQVDLVPRTVDTVSFTAPQVTSETKLNFQLTVADADHATGKTNAVVTVEPIRDADHFLEYLAVSNKFTVTAVTSVPVPSVASATYNAALPFTVTVQKLVAYTDINGVMHDGVNQPLVAIGAPETYTSGWATPLGTGGTNCADARNPQLQIPIPKLNLDDKLADGSARLSDVLETSDVDQDPAVAGIPPAVVYAQISIQSTALPSGTAPGICVNGSAATAPMTASSESLIPIAPSNTAPRDNSASAHVYYATIDPNHARTTLNAWLTVNGFNPDVSGWAADAHAVYTNGFDLGLGRDMYLKFGACDNGAAALPLEQRRGKCDVATVVVNYATVQAAANRLNPIVAVAMEYSAVVSGGPRFVKFYTFAPDTRTGAFQRVTSVDLDHRGQKSMPQACVVCHGGIPGTVTTNAGATAYSTGGAVNGNLNAGFLSWDLDSFYYSDTDPGFSQKAEDAALKAQYTRAKQEAQFKLLNTGAYLTLDDPNRYALAQELMEGWYGGPGLPNSTFDGSYVPPGWMPGGPNNNPGDSATLYTNVFARECRACHVLQVPAAGTATAYVDPRTVPQSSGSSVSSCSSAATTSGAVTLHQVPMGCYWEFANARNLPLRLSDGDMPFARRTMDRQWVQADGSPSDGETLQKHFAAQTPAVTISTPGTSIARYANAPNSPSTVYVLNDSATDPASNAPVDIGNAVRLDASTSAFPDAVSWTVNACTGTFVSTSQSPGSCQRGLPVVGSGNLVAWYVLDDAVTYQLTLQLDSATGLASAAPYYFQVPEIDPKFVSPLPTLSLQVGAQKTLSRASLFSYGNGGAALNTVLLTSASSDITVAPAACAVKPGCSGSSIESPNGITVTSTGSSAETTSIGITVTGAGSSPTQTQTGSIAVTVTAGVTAPPPILLLSVASNSGPVAVNLLTAVGGIAAFPGCSNGLQVSQVSYIGTRKSTWSFNASSQTLTYTPQAGFATYSHGGTTLLNGTEESFQYVLLCTHSNNVVETSNPGTMYIPVEARVTFSAVQQVWANPGNCQTCHGTTTPSAPQLGNNTVVGYPELSTGFLDDSVLSPPPPPIIPRANLHLSFVDLLSLGNNPPDLSSVNTSGLLCWPNDSCPSQTVIHTGGYFCLPGTTQPTITAPGIIAPCTTNTELSTVTKWIQDGANDF